MSDPNVPSGDAFPEVDDFLAEVLYSNDVADIELDHYKAMVDQDFRRTIELAQATGLRLDPLFTKQLEADTPLIGFDEDPIFYRLSHASTLAALLSETSESTHRNTLIDELTVTLIDPSEPEWPKWRDLGSQLLGEELLLGVDETNIQHVLDQVLFRVLQASVAEATLADLLRGVRQKAEWTLSARFGERDDQWNIVMNIATFSHVQNTHPRYEPFKEQLILWLMDVYTLDSNEAQELLSEILQPNDEI